jgi:hypothetical protein
MAWWACCGPSAGGSPLVLRAGGLANGVDAELRRKIPSFGSKNIH